VLARLQRNYEAMDALNQRKPDRALAILDTPLASEFADGDAIRSLQIGPALAGQLASESNADHGRIFAQPDPARTGATA
jgi:hypothetical protein